MSQIQGGDFWQQGGVFDIRDSIGETIIFGNYKFDAGTIVLDLAGPAQHDQLQVFGVVDLLGNDQSANSVLDIVLAYEAAIGDSFTIIDNDDVDPIIGMFANGQRVTASFNNTLFVFAIDYDGGTGNDITLTVIPETIVAETIDVTKGVVRSGDVGALSESDDVDLSVVRDSTLVQAEIELTAKGISFDQSPTSIRITLEASVFARGEINQTIELYNYDVGEFELVDSRAASRFSDQVTTVVPSGNASRFVEQGTGCVEARIRFSSSVNRAVFTANIDHLNWEVN